MIPDKTEVKGLVLFSRWRFDLLGNDLQKIQIRSSYPLYLVEIVMFLRKLLNSLRFRISSIPRATGNGDSLREFCDNLI